jgi:hypothetical protein
MLYDHDIDSARPATPLGLVGRRSSIEWADPSNPESMI